MSKWSFWIDRGGTFTDSIALDPTGKLLISKHLSINPSKYKDATIHSIKQFLSIPKNIPSKLCSVCERPFNRRKKWKKDWVNVKYCSKKCRKNKTN